jgi:pimeloyl-ACP methyl ester carboxylesterase
VLVGHSLGGVVVRRLLADPALRAEFADLRARIAAVALLSTPDDRIEKPVPSLARLATTPDLALAAGLVVGAVRRAFVAAVSEGADPADLPPREEVLRMESELSCAARRRAQRTMLLRIAPLRPDGSPDEEACSRRCAQQAIVDRPCLILHGDRDGLVSPSDAARCAARIRGSRVVMLRGAGHALPTERPVELVREIEAWARDCGVLPPGD